MSKPKTVFIPPPNFGYVEPDLFRSAVPNEMNFPFLQTLHLKTVVYLSLDAPSLFFLEFLKEQNIELVQISGSENTSMIQKISEKLIIDALHLLLDPKKYPILVMCNLGRHRTGTVIGCLRRIQKWSLSATLVEFRRFTNSKPSPPHEQFIEMFDTELVELPEDVEKLPFKIGKKKVDREDGTKDAPNSAQQPQPKKKITFMLSNTQKKSSKTLLNV